MYTPVYPKCILRVYLVYTNTPNPARKTECSTLSSICQEVFMKIFIGDMTYAQIQRMQERGYKFVVDGDSEYADVTKENDEG